MRQRDALRDEAIARQQADWARERGQLEQALCEARRDARAAKQEASSLRAQLRAVCKNMRPPPHLMPDSSSADKAVRMPFGANSGGSTTRGHSALDPESMAAL